MKIWVVLFFVLLAVGVAFGIARDLFSRERATLQGVVIAFDAGRPTPKYLPGSSPRYSVRLTGGQVVSVATTAARGRPGGSEIQVTEWVTPWGQVWYTQRD